MHRVLDATATLPTIRLALRLILLTLVRKSELIEATWDEVDFENAVWTIPKEPHEGRQAPQRVPVAAGARHHGGAAHLRGSGPSSCPRATTPIAACRRRP